MTEMINDAELLKRQIYIDELEEYITTAKQQLNNLLKKEEVEGPEEEEYQKKDDVVFVTCPYNSNHRMPEASLEKHRSKCKYKVKGYTDEEIELVNQDLSFFYEKSPTVVTIKLDNADNLPLTGERAQYELSRQQRLEMYDHVRYLARVQNAANVVSEQELMLLQDSKGSKRDTEKPKSYLERLAEERDFKRRRQSYRAKNVHITRKTHTEVIREVITNQMELLEQMWEEEDDVTQKHIKSEQQETKMLKNIKREKEDESEPPHMDVAKIQERTVPPEKKFRPDRFSDV